MTVQQHVRGEEYTTKLEAGFISPAAEIVFGLYDDSADNLSNTDDLSAINTEPTTGNYSRKTFSLNSSEFTVEKNNNDNWQYTKDEFDWNVGGTEENVDSFFAVISFNGDGDSSATEHLVFTGSLDQFYDLTNHDTLTVNSIGRVQEGV